MRLHSGPAVVLSCLLAGLFGGCQATAPSGEPVPAPAPASHPPVDQRTAVERAIQAASIAYPGEWLLESVAPAEWPDSSLGCPHPNLHYLQVVTAGYAVHLVSGDRRLEVHVAGDSAVLCRADMQGLGLPTGGGVRAGGLQEMQALARQDLARRLGIDPQTLDRVQVTPTQWPDSSLGCPQPGERVRQIITPGYTLTFIYAGRVYEYNTDLNRVIPCPPIESQ